MKNVLESLQPLRVAILLSAVGLATGVFQSASAEDVNPEKLALVNLVTADVQNLVPLVYNEEVVNTPLADGTGIQGTTTSQNIGNPDTWEYYFFCGNEGDVIDIEVHRTTSDMDPAMQICLGTADDTGGISFGGCGPDMSFVARADDNNGIPHGVGGLFADPKIQIALPSTGTYTLMVFDFIGAGPNPQFEIHADGIAGCEPSLTKGIISGPDCPDEPEGQPAPASITFETLVTSCGALGDQLDFYLNGVLLGSQEADPALTCTCSPPLLTTLVVADAGLIADAWNSNGCNTFRVVKSGLDSTFSWSRAQFDASSHCIFDVGGGDCTVLDVCSALFTFDSVDESSAVGGDGEIDLAVEVGQFESTKYDFKVTYFGGFPEPPAPVLIEDTVPAEWMVELLDDGGNATAQGANDDGDDDDDDDDDDATKISWTPDPLGGMITVWAMTRERPNGKFAPTSCGALYLNDGAQAFELDPVTGEPLDLPPILASNSLCLAAVEDVNGDGEIARDGSGDEDGDGLTDYEEACVIGSDPCDPCDPDEQSPACETGDDDDDDDDDEDGPTIITVGGDEDDD